VAALGFTSPVLVRVFCEHRAQNREGVQGRPDLHGHDRHVSVRGEEKMNQCVRHVDVKWGSGT